MSTKPDLQVRYECDGCGWHDEGIGGKHSRPATITELVAVLIAEGGETIWWCETHGCQGVTGPSGAGKWCICVNVGLTGETIEDREQEASKQGCRMVEKLLAPIPVESAEAKET